MDQAARERIEREVTDAASQRFPDAVHGVVVLQHAIGRSIGAGRIPGACGAFEAGQPALLRTAAVSA
jgi:hypothetical protein